MWNKSYILLLFGQWVSLMGTAAYEMALPMYILRMSSSPALLGLIMAAAVGPFAVMAPFGGVVIDRWSRKWIIVICDFASGAVVLPAAWLAARGGLSVPFLVLTVGLLSFLAAFFIPAVMASVPNMVPQRNLTRAMSLMDGGRQASLVAGPALGGLLIVYLGYPWAFLVNGISFIVAGVAELFINVPQTQQQSKFQLYSELSVGWKYMLKERPILALALAIMVVNIFEPAVIPIILPVVANQIGVGEPGYATMRTVVGVGSLLSAIVLATAKEQRHKMFVVVVMMAVFGVALAGSGLTHNYIVLNSFVGLYGLALGIVNTLLVVVLQVLLPDEVRGRVFALINTLAISLVPLSYIAIGALLGGISPGIVLVASGVVSLLGAAALRSIRELQKV